MRELMFPYNIRLTLHEMVKTLTIQGNMWVELLHLWIQRSQLRWFEHLERKPSDCLPVAMYQAWTTGWRPWSRPRICRRDYIWKLAWECLGIFRRSWNVWLGKGKFVLTCSVSCHHDPHQGKQKNEWMNECYLKPILVMESALLNISHNNATIRLCSHIPYCSKASGYPRLGSQSVTILSDQNP